MSKVHTPKSRFLELDAGRSTLLLRCEQYAAWTIPSKFPPANTNDNYEMAIDFQAVGAKCVNNLLNKVMLALFAPSRPFFRPELEQAEIEEMARGGIEGAALDAVLSQVAKQGMKTLEAMQVRAPLTEAIGQLIIVGNCLLRYDEDDDQDGDAITTFTLRDYVVRRGLRGKLLETITREASTLDSMPIELQTAYRTKFPKAKPEQAVALYTRYEWQAKGEVWVQTQSIEEVDVTTGRIQYQEKDLPIRVLTWSLAPKRNYGTGLVEESQGAFHGLSTLSSAEIAGLLEMCRIIHLADPTGSTDALEFQNALSGAVLVGRADDISTPDLGGKARDYQAVANKIAQYTSILSEIFLLANGAVRNAERVTAEEIRLIANELETSKGGVYSRLSFDLQQWLADIAIKKSQVASLRKLKVYVITGLDALSANGDLDNLRAFQADLAATKDVPEEIRATFIWDSYVQLLASLHNVDYFKFLKSQQQAQDEKAATEANAMAQQQELAATDAVSQVAVNQLSQETQ